MLFKSDIQALRKKWEKKASSLKKERQPREAKWKEIRDFFEPETARALDGPGNDVNDADESRINNSYPRLVAQRMSSGMQGGITNPATQWFNLISVDESIAEQSNVKNFVQETARRMASVLSKSNFYLVFILKYLQSGLFGTSCSILVPDDEFTARMIFCDLGSFWIAVDNRGRVNVLLRRSEYSANQLVGEFGEESVKDDTDVQKALKDKSEKLFVVWNLVEPNDGSSPDIAKGRKFASYYWRDGSGDKMALAIRSYGYNPIICPRWYLISGAYGYGCGHIALNDNKSLQAMEEDSLFGIAMEARPPSKAPTSMREEVINAHPGGVTYYDEIDAGRGGSSFGKLFDYRFEIEQVESKIRQTEGRIDKAFYTDLFAMILNLSMQPREMTARQISELSQEKMSLLGPVLTRMNTDMLDPLIDGLYAIMESKDQLPELPDVLKGKQLAAEYISVLHTEQQSAMRLGGIIKLADIIAMVLPAAPDAADKFDGDQAIDEAGKALNVAANVVRSDSKVAERRAARAEAEQRNMQAMAQAELLRSAPKGVKDLSEAQMAGGGSALDGLMGRGGR